MTERERDATVMADEPLDSGFQVFHRGVRRADRIEHVTIMRNGMLFLSRATLEALGDPEAVLLLFDPETYRLAFEAADRSNPDAYSVGKGTPGKQRSSGSRGMINGLAFCRHVGIPLGVRRKYLAQRDGGRMVIDLKSPIEIVPPEKGS
jgi:hypothetical protein